MSNINNQFQPVDRYDKYRLEEFSGSRLPPDPSTLNPPTLGTIASKSDTLKERIFNIISSSFSFINIFSTSKKTESIVDSKITTLPKVDHLRSYLLNIGYIDTRADSTNKNTTLQLEYLTRIDRFLNEFNSTVLEQKKLGINAKAGDILKLSNLRQNIIRDFDNIKNSEEYAKTLKTLDNTIDNITEYALERKERGLLNKFIRAGFISDFVAEKLGAKLYIHYEGLPLKVQTTKEILENLKINIQNDLKHGSQDVLQKGMKKEDLEKYRRNILQRTEARLKKLAMQQEILAENRPKESKEIVQKVKEAHQYIKFHYISDKNYSKNLYKNYQRYSKDPGEISDEVLDKFINEHLILKDESNDWKQWQQVKKEDQINLYENARKYLEIFEPIKIPGLYHATESPIAILKSSIEVRAEKKLEGAFVSDKPESFYGSYAFAFDPSDIEWQDIPLQDFDREGRQWTGYSTPIAVNIRSAGEKTSGRARVAYMITPEKQVELFKEELRENGFGHLEVVGWDEATEEARYLKDIVKHQQPIREAAKEKQSINEDWLDRFK